MPDRRGGDGDFRRGEDSKRQSRAAEEAALLDLFRGRLESDAVEM
jgi:hypothetical protein